MSYGTNYDDPFPEPPEPAPDSPKWITPATWNSEIGVWERCGGIVVTEATRENWRAYAKAQLAAKTQAKEAEEAAQQRRKAAQLTARRQPRESAKNGQPALFDAADPTSYPGT